jgi:hypothetical protein
VQQPFGQLVDEQPVHTPPTQCCFDAHGLHAEPAVPHDRSELPARHDPFEQHPLGQDAPSQMHCPWKHRWPATQAAPVPHVHAPLALHPSPVAPHTEHPPPAVPQVVGPGVSQMPFLQQPFGHDVASHTHCPLEHRCPGEHSAAEPHEHAPLTHPFAREVSHDVQDPPPAPHDRTPGVVHVPLVLQHPFGHDVALHTHWPLTHCWPAWHGLPAPHAQLPVDVQLSVVVWLHATQAAPPKPHAFGDRALHVGPEQHPVAHVCAHPVHAPDMQLSPPGQLAHALPPLPQAPSLLPGWHVLLAQHPFGHETPSQTHAPLRHRCPAEHAAPAPHLHWPPLVHESELFSAQGAHEAPGGAHAASDGVVQALPVQHPSGHDVASQTHTPCAQCSPCVQGNPVPHRHVPLVSHRSAASALHAMHDSPPVPQVAGPRTSHVVPLQHPAGHEVASQMHAPAMHRWPLLHAVFPPQVHAPPAEQPSVSVASHITHAAPPAPHVAGLAGWHSVPEQHPLEHWHPLHAPAAHVSPDGHALHALPAAPHRDVAVPGSHVLPLQHPVGHDVASQTHCPPAHRWPEAHAGPLPHAQPPVASQPSLVTALHPVQTHAPPTQSRPGGHGAPPPHAGPRLA